MRRGNLLNFQLTRVTKLADYHCSHGRVLWRDALTHCPGPARFVAVVKMVTAGVVEVDRQLHEPQAQHAAVEVDVLRASAVMAVT